MSITRRFSSDGYSNTPAEPFLHDASYTLNASGHISTWSPPAESLTLYAPPEILGQPFAVLFSDEDCGRDEPSRTLKAAAAAASDWEGSLRRKDGTVFRAHMRIEPVFHDTEHIGFAAVFRDVSAQHETRQKLASTLYMLDLALTNISQGFAVFDSAGALVLSNQKYGEILGIPAQEVRAGMVVRDLIKLGAGDSGEKIYQDYLDHRDAGSAKYVIRIRDRAILVHKSSLPDGGWVSTFEDVTEIEKAEAEIRRMVNHDPLTQLPNRTLFRDYLAQYAALAKNGVRFAVLKVHVNGFNSINDKFGRTVGDELLKEVAARLRTCIRGDDRLARVGGDEFAILQASVREVKQAEALADRILQALSQPYLIPPHEVLADASIGISIAPADGIDIDELGRVAHLALRRAMLSRVAGFSVYNSSNDAQLETRLTLEQDLRQALRRNEFSIHYQGLFGLRTGKLTGYEALLRWHHSARGPISPADFIPTAEDSGLIVPIGRWALQQTLHDAASWPKGLKVAVNLSATQLKDEQLPDLVNDALLASGLDPECLELEITESTLMDQSERILRTLRQFQKQGIRIALDDFGTGYSSLGYLRNFPFNRLKIDRCFIQELAHDSQSRILTQAVTALGASFRMEVTAEGIETPEQLEQLRLIGCDEVQGFYFSRPKPANEVAAEIQAHIGNGTNPRLHPKSFATRDMISSHPLLKPPPVRR